VNDDSIKLTSYFGERHRTGGRFVADALLDLYGRNEIAIQNVHRALAAMVDLPLE